MKEMQKRALITGAGGQTGKAIIRALSGKNVFIRAWAHKKEQAKELQKIGASDVFVGDMENKEDIKAACEGMDCIYLICPAFHPKEAEIGRMFIDESENQRISHFVYHSVFHSLLTDLPHHIQKRQVEEYLVTSGIPFTILQPAILMQNLLPAYDGVSNSGIWVQKFFKKDNNALCMVDLEDVAQTAARVLCEGSPHYGATYELCGPRNLRLPDILSAWEKELGKEVLGEYIPDAVITDGLRKGGAGGYKIDGMLRMFRHYNTSDFPGNPNTLTWLLGRKPKDLEEVLERYRKGS